MLFTVSVFVAGRQYWGCLVEAEDRDGAVREAMNLLAEDPHAGHYVFGHTAHRLAGTGPTTVQVGAVERTCPLLDQLRAATLNALRAHA